MRFKGFQFPNFLMTVNTFSRFIPSDGRTTDNRGKAWCQSNSAGFNTTITVCYGHVNPRKALHKK